MSDQVHHCPFLNRADSRCSENFSLDRLDHAFGHCFGHYRSCAVYQELLVERRGRRAERMQYDVQEPLVQVTIRAGAHRFLQRRAGAAKVPAVSGV